MSLRGCLFVSLALALMSHALAQDAAHQDRIESLPGYGPVTSPAHYSGYLPTSDAYNTSLFYWLVESQTDPSNDPVILWLNGGPGCASTVGFFVEIGPFQLTPEGPLKVNPLSWNRRANVIFIDQPVGTGFSFAPVESLSTNVWEAVENVFHALEHFFSKRHSRFLNRDLYLAGESYAGKYLPALATRIVAAEPWEMQLPLKGIAVGDGFVDPLTQRFVGEEEAYGGGLLNPFQTHQLEVISRPCKRAIMTQDFVTANLVCGRMEKFIRLVTGGVDLYDNRIFENVFNKTMWTTYLNNPAVRAALHIPVSNVTFGSDCNPDVMVAMGPDRMRSMAQVLVDLVPHIRVLLYNGNFDLKDGPIGPERYLTSVEWPQKKEFIVAERSVWNVSGRVGGYVKSVGNLTFLTVLGAGHFLPHDQPELAQSMIETFIYGPKEGRGFAYNITETFPHFVQNYIDLLGQCSGRGEFVKNRCICQRGYAGADCGSPLGSVSAADIQDGYPLTLEGLELEPQEWVYYRLAIDGDFDELDAAAAAATASTAEEQKTTTNQTSANAASPRGDDDNDLEHSARAPDAASTGPHSGPAGSVPHRDRLSPRAPTAYIRFTVRVSDTTAHTVGYQPVATGRIAILAMRNALPQLPGTFTHADAGVDSAERMLTVTVLPRTAYYIGITNQGGGNSVVNITLTAEFPATLTASLSPVINGAGAAAGGDADAANSSSKEHNNNLFSLVWWNFRHTLYVFGSLIAVTALGGGFFLLSRSCGRYAVSSLEPISAASSSAAAASSDRPVANYGATQQQPQTA